MNFIDINWLKLIFQRQYANLEDGMQGHEFWA
jgi:hypothetical protein